MANGDKSEPVLTGDEINTRLTRPDPPLWRGWKEHSSFFDPGSAGLGDTRVCIVLCYDGGLLLRAWCLLDPAQ